MYLEEIIVDIKLENDKFECKARLNRNDIVGGLKTRVLRVKMHSTIFLHRIKYMKQATLRI